MKSIITVLLLLFTQGCQVKPKAQAFDVSQISFPVAEKKNKKLEIHGHVRQDPYYWMNDRKNPKVVSYLNEENEIFEKFIKSQKKQVDDVFQELKKRTAEDDSSYPVKKKNYYYWSEVKKGQEHELYYRSTDETKKKNVEILIDENALAKGQDYLDTTGPRISPDETLMSYGVDTQGRRFYTHYFKNLKTGKILDTKIKSVTANLVWTNDSETVLYVKNDPDTLRAYQVYRFHLPSGKNELIYEEKNAEFSIGLDKSLNGQHILLYCYHLQTVEVRFMDANFPLSKFQTFRKRKNGVKDSLDFGKDRVYLLTNEKDKNYEVYSFAFQDYKNPKKWTSLKKKSKDTYIDDVTALDGYLVTFQKNNGLDEVVVYDEKTKDSQLLKFDDESYAIEPAISGDFDQKKFRITYNSLRVPQRLIAVDLKTLKQTVLKEAPVPYFKSSNYRTERKLIKSRDGKLIPVSLLMKRNFKPTQNNPLLVYGYGSYGYAMKPGLTMSALSLVDRGFVYAIAHIRGGDDLGRDWYDDGRMKNKMNTFNDFIDVTEGLINLGYGKKGHIYARGGSAGGLLMGAIANLRPDLYNGIVAEVPFVDVLTTMLDDTIPLTTFEYQEWGNPNIKSQYNWMKAYSPYDNVEKKAYPNMLIRSGFHDSQVQYWEPTKWTAKLRVNNTSNSLILLRTNMEAGHGGLSGRYQRLQEAAEMVGFLLWLENKK